MFLKISLEKM